MLWKSAWRSTTPRAASKNPLEKAEKTKKEENSCGHLEWLDLAGLAKKQL